MDAPRLLRIFLKNINPKMPNSGLVKETKQSIKTLSSTCKKYANVLPIQTCGTKTNHRPRPYLEYILPPSLISGKFVVAGK